MERSVTLTVEKETKGTYRFTEDGIESEHIFGTVYVKKSALDGMKPTKVRMDVSVE